jgi:hypothetical protein
VLSSWIEDGGAALALPPDGLVVGALRAELPLRRAHLHGRARRAATALALAERRLGSQSAQLLLLVLSVAAAYDLLNETHRAIISATTCLHSGKHRCCHGITGTAARRKCSNTSVEWGSSLTCTSSAGTA